MTAPPVGTKALRRFVLFLFLFSAIFSLRAEDNLVMNVYLGFNGAFQSGMDVPLRIRLRNEGPGIDGDLYVEIADEKGGILRRDLRAVELPSGSRKEFFFLLRLNSSSRIVHAGISGPEGDILRRRIDLGRRRYVDPLILVVSPRNSFDFLLALPPVRDGDFQVVHLHPEDLPPFGTAYDGVRLVILHDIPLSGLDRHRVEAIAEWVDAGGCLIVSFGGNPSFLSSGEAPLRALLPADITRIRVVDRLVLEDMVIPGPLPVTETVPTCPGGSILGSYGRGRVIFIPFDSTTDRLSPEMAAHFWNSFPVDPLEDRLAGPVVAGLHRFPITILRADMAGFPGRGGAAVFSFVMLGLYFLLFRFLSGRSFGRRISPVLIIIFTVLAVAGALILFHGSLKTPPFVMASFSLLQGACDRNYLDILTETLIFSPRILETGIVLPEGARPFWGSRPLTVRIEGKPIIEQIRVGRWEDLRISTEAEIVQPISLWTEKGEGKIENQGIFPVHDAFILGSEGLAVLGDLPVGAGPVAVPEANPGPGKVRLSDLPNGGRIPGLLPVEKGILSDLFGDPAFSSLIEEGKTFLIGWVDGDSFSGFPDYAGTRKVISRGLLLLDISSETGVRDD